MKLFWLPIWLAIFGLLWLAVKPLEDGGFAELSLTEARLNTPAPAGVSVDVKTWPETVPKTPYDAQQQLHKIAALARFALPTQDTRTALINSLSDPSLPSSLRLILQEADNQDYNAEQERLRMNAVSVLGLMLKYKDVSHRDEILQLARQRILTVDFDRMLDIRVKQSVFGDITEMLMVLKQYDTETFQDLAFQISESKKKVLHTALAASRSS